MELDMHIIGARIRDRRKKLGLTQLDIKASAGISSGNISDIENGNRLPAASTLVQLAGILDCSVDWILTGNIPARAGQGLRETEDEAEQRLLQGFRRLPLQEQEEMLEILQVKLHKVKKAKETRSSRLPDTSDDDLAG